MEPVLMAIAALALLGLGGLFLLDRRFARVFEQLGRLDQLDAIAQRIQVLGAELDRKELNTQLQSKITEFTESDRRLASALAEVQQELQDLRRAHERGRASDRAGARTQPPDVATVVRGHLAGEGFERIQILTDLTHLEGRSGRIVFEARRDGAMHKGHVSLRDGAVVEQSVRAAYSAFP